MIRIGTLSIDNPVFLAPMAGITNLNARLLARESGCGLAFTEMVSAAGLIRRMAKTFRYLDTSLSDTPLGIQIFGSDPAAMAEAALIAAGRCGDLIDINMGCPVRKVVRSGAGAALMRDPQRAGGVIAAVRRATVLPLTVKIRAGWRRSEINAAEIARIAEDEGADAVTVHPRTADQGFGGVSDWSVIRQVKEALKIPVIGNGDVHTPEDALRMMDETGCDAVMVGRGALGNPWIFGETVSLIRTGVRPGRPTLADREAMILRHLDMEIAAIGGGPGIRNFRKHLLWYTRGLKSGAALRQSLGQITDREALLKAIADHFEGQIRP